MGGVLVTDGETARIEEARRQLARYLSDEIAPMIFANAAEDLFRAPPELVGREIRAWIAIQVQGANPSDICDYLLHSAKKVHHLGELELLPFDELQGYLARLNPILLGLCPDQDRARLAMNLDRLEVHTKVIAAQISVGRSPSAGGAPASPGSAAAHGGRAERAPGQSPAPSDHETSNVQHRRTSDPAGTEDLLLSRVIDEVAATSRRTAELENQLRLLGGIGVDGLDNGVFKTLSGALPDWAPSRRPPSTAEQPLPGPARTMRRYHRRRQRDGHLAVRRSLSVRVAEPPAKPRRLPR